jgi:hypothetical protein
VTVNEYVAAGSRHGQETCNFRVMRQVHAYLAPAAQPEYVQPQQADQAHRSAPSAYPPGTAQRLMKRLTPADARRCPVGDLERDWGWRPITLSCFVGHDAEGWGCGWRSGIGEVMQCATAVLQGLSMALGVRLAQAARASPVVRSRGRRARVDALC